MVFGFPWWKKNWTLSNEFIQNFGRSKSESDSVMKYICSKVKLHDIVVIQEVSTSEFGAQAVAKLDGLLDRTGTSWDYVVSDPTTGPGSERYAYLYKKSRVKLKESGLEKTLQDKINREPFRAVFIFKKNEYFKNFTRNFYIYKSRNMYL